MDFFIRLSLRLWRRRRLFFFNSCTGCHCTTAQFGWRLLGGGEPPERGPLETDLELNQRLIAADSTDRSQPGFQLFMSPHVNPILALGPYVYVTNTPNGTVDVIDADTRLVVQQIEVGLEPMSLAARPDSSEIWVSNHVSDSVNVIDTSVDSPLYTL